jgi:uncharacterized protein with HEPN domain
MRSGSLDERDRQHLVAALESARWALKHADSGGPEWQTDQKTVDAVSKRVEDVGEQAKRLSDEQQAALPEVPWAEVKGMRDRVVHDYGRLDVRILADVVEFDLPDFIGKVEAALAKAGDDSAASG